MRRPRPARPPLGSLLALAMASCLVFAPGVRAQAPFPGFDDYVARAMRDWNVPGLSIAIVRNDSVIYARGFGVVELGTRTPVNEETLFEIGSSSKAFTATLVAMLVTDGRMRFDDRVAAHLPGFTLRDPVANAEVTLRDALSHRSGLSRGELVWLGSGVSRAEVLHRARFQPPSTPFRSSYAYQNVMVLAAGEAAGKAAGTTWDDLVTRRIFEPLGMASTRPTSEAVTSRNAATPHGLVRDSAYIKPRTSLANIGPAGSIVSNARDMAQWLRFQLNDGMVGGKRLVSTAAFRETHTPQMLMGAGAQGPDADTERVTSFNTYGLGWMIQDYRGQLMWQHGGNTDGMTTALGMLPDRKFGVVVLSNMLSTPLPGLLMRYVFDRQLGAPMKDLSAEALARAAARRRRADSAEAAGATERRTAQPPLALSAFVGTYSDSLYGEATVTLEDGRLMLRRGDWHGPLEYWNATNFRWTILPTSPIAQLFLKFEISPADRVTGLYFGLPGDQTLLNRKEAPGGRGRPGGR